MGWTPEEERIRMAIYEQNSLIREQTDAIRHQTEQINNNYENSRSSSDGGWFLFDWWNDLSPKTKKIILIGVPSFLIGGSILSYAATFIIVVLYYAFAK